MINVNDFKNGMTIKVEGNIYTIIEFQHVKPGKGAAFVRTKLKNLRTGSTIEYTFNSGVKCETARIERKPMQYLYNIGDDVKYLKENQDLDITFYEGEVLGLSLPDKIELEVIETEPAVKGNTTSNASKEATLETGYQIRVPLFIEQGEKVIISTKDGKYVSRA